MSLVSLPAELLQQICRYVRKMDFLVSGVREYRSLALSCHQLYKIALPYLYRYLYLNPLSTQLLVRSIFEKPELALAIKDVTIGGYDKAKWQPDLGKAYTLLRKPGLLPKACTRHLHPGDHETICILLVEALLLQLPNLEELSIDIDGYPRNVVFFDKKRWKSGNEAYLSQLLPALKEFTFFAHPRLWKSQNGQNDEQGLQEDEQEPDEDEEESDADDWETDEDDDDERERRDYFAQVQGLIALSKPRDLYIESDYPLEYSSLGLTLPSLEKFDIWCEGMSPIDFESLLQSCPNVRSIGYSGGSGTPLSDDFEDGEPISLRGVVRSALRHRQHTLESLEIGYFHEEDNYVMVHDTIPDLRPFSRLTNLKLDCNSLFNLPEGDFLTIQSAKVEFIDKLPPTLEKLRIFQAYEKHLEEFKSLARRKAQDLPNFKTLILEWWCGKTQGPLDDLEDDLLKAGIELVLE